MAKRTPRVGPSSRSNQKSSSFLSRIDSYFDIKGKKWSIELFGKEPSEIVFPYNKEQLDAPLMFEYWKTAIRSDQIRSVAQSCLTLCDPMNHSTPGLPVYHQLLEFTQTHVHRVSDAIQPSHPLSSPSPLAPNPSQHQSLLQ